MTAPSRRAPAAPSPRVVRLVSDLERARASSVVATSRLLLEAAAAGDQPETLRLFVPASCVAFGPKDMRAPGSPRAVEAARAHGFEPVQRLEGGRAAAAHEQTLGIAWTIPDPDGRTRIRERYAEAASMVVEALRGLGVDARIGAVLGEYCPGDYSINAGGVVKLMGLGQRVIRGAVHVGGTLLVSNHEAARAVLVSVYRELDLQWDQCTLGSLASILEVPVALEAVAEAVIEAASRHLDLRVPLEAAS